MLSSGHGPSALPGLLYHAPPRHLYDDDSSDEYGSCTEAPLYENVNDDDEDDDLGVYENVAFEPPAYSNLDGLAPGLGLRLSEEDLDEDGQVYANVPAREEAPTYDVPQRRPAPQGPAAYRPQEYANLQPASQPGQPMGQPAQPMAQPAAQLSNGAGGEWVSAAYARCM